MQNVFKETNKRKVSLKCPVYTLGINTFQPNNILQYNIMNYYPLGVAKHRKVLFKHCFLFLFPKYHKTTLFTTTSLTRAVSSFICSLRTFSACSSSLSRISSPALWNLKSCIPCCNNSTFLTFNSSSLCCSLSASLIFSWDI